ncbi:MAG: acyl-CoA dehydrogenase family protein, partial [Methanobacteriota archaeon]
LELGGAPQGLRRMVEMLTLSRIYNAVASVGVMRRAIVEAVLFARTRRTFGTPLLDHPLHRATLVDLLLEWEGGLALVIEVSRLLDRVDAGTDSEADRLRLRFLVPVAKLTLGGRAVEVASAAVEAVGGIGYTHDTVMPRLLADAQVLPIWEGTTNVLALDVLRAARKEQAHWAVFGDAAARLEKAARADPELGRHLSTAMTWVSEDFLEMLKGDPRRAELRAADVADRTGRIVEATLLLEHAHATGDEGDLEAAHAYGEAFVLGTRDLREDLALRTFHAFLERAVPAP